MSEKLTGDYQKTLDKRFLGYWDVPEDDDLILTIDHFEKSEVRNNSGVVEKKHICFFKESKPMIVNKTNLKSIAAVIGSDKFEDWENQRIALYAADVKQAESGKGLRVRPYKPKEDYICDECGKPIRAAYGKSPKAMMNYTLDKYNRPLCAECAKIEAEKVITDEE